MCNLIQNDNFRYRRFVEMLAYQKLQLTIHALKVLVQNAFHFFGCFRGVLHGVVGGHNFL